MRLSIPLLCMMLLAEIVVPARAGFLSGTISGESVFSVSRTDSPSVVSQTFSGGGKDSTYGAFNAAAQSIVDSSHPSDILLSDGTFTMTFANKGRLAGSFSGSVTPNGNETTFTIDVSITSGSGIFAGATGTMIFTGDITYIDPQQFGVYNIGGTYLVSLAIPEPNTLTLVAPAIAGGVGVLLRRRRRKSTAPPIGPPAIH